MENKLRNVTEILSRSISGFHQYCLTPPARPCYVSQNLCALLGYPEGELLSEREDLYARCIVPGDRETYDAFLESMGHTPQTRTLQYRLMKKDGTVMFVSDTMTSYLQDGVMVGDSVLTDITQLKNENQNLRYLSETMPCGFVKYTCEKIPRVTYINDQMLQFFGFSQSASDGFDAPELYMQNIYLMIPPEGRQKFAQYLERVYQQGGPIAGEMTVLRRDGTKAYLFGWVTKSVNEWGEAEFQSACMDITERHNLKKERETQRYLKALTDVYDKVFEFDLSARTVKCLYGQSSPAFKWIENVSMQLEDATDRWITATVCEEDRDRVLTFFRDYCSQKLTDSGSRPPQIQYRALSSDGRMKQYAGVFGSTSLYCCRHVPQQESEELISKYNALKDMQQLVMRFTEGVVAFEVENDTVKPLYTSENVCSFFGYTREQWLSLAEKPQSIRDFISQSGIAYEDVRKLFSTGEAEFTYFDMTQNAYRRIKAICSQKNTDGILKTYVMLYNVDTKEAQTAEVQPGKTVRIRTFGYFDVFVDDKPIAFRHEKSKELFALLVDRRGGFVSSEEAISFLWEEESANSVTLARYRKVALRLKNLLEEYGISDVVESVNGKRRIAAEKVRCDLYDYLSGQEAYAQLFKGSYLTNYSWGETTLAELTGDHFYGTGV